MTTGGIAPNPGEGEITTTEQLRAEQEHSSELAGQQIEGGEPQPPAAEPPQPGEPETEPKPLRRITPQDEARAAIAARFKERRASAGGQLDFHGDHRDPTQIYGQVVSPPAPEDEPLAAVAHLPDPGVPTHATAEPPAAQPTAEPPPASATPQKLFKAKVNGVDVLLTEEQMVAEAQKSLAAGDLLEQAKRVYRGAKQDGAPAPNQSGDDPARSSQTQPTRSPNQEPTIDELVQELQFGEPAEVAPKLERTIESRAQAAAREAVLRERVESEVVSSRRVLAKFEQDNADLARDEFARDAIEKQVYREYGKDLVALGIPADQIPADPVTRAAWHNQLRATGGRVRDIGAVLNAARDEFVRWRGGARAAPQPNPRPAGKQPAAPGRLPASAAAPRIEVTVNRDDRRAAIPTQPPRTSVPPMPAPAQPQRRDASDVIMQMRKARNQIVA
jgi:hypothetical protein